jgi:hypothetical protein
LLEIESGGEEEEVVTDEDTQKALDIVSAFATIRTHVDKLPTNKACKVLEHLFKKTWILRHYQTAESIGPTHRS